MKPSLDELLDEATTLVRNISNRAGRLEDDVIQAARIGAWQAWQRYDEHAEHFATYARTRVFGAVMDEFRAAYPAGLRRKRRHPGAVGMPYPEDIDGHEVEWPSLPLGWEAECEDQVLWIVATLPPKLAEAVIALYLHAETDTLLKVARKMGVSESLISLRRKQAFEALRTRGRGDS